MLTSSAPTRIDLAGGTIDIWPLYLFHDGASTINAAISLRAHVQIEPHKGGNALTSIDTGGAVRVAHWSELSASSPLPLVALTRYHLAGFCPTHHWLKRHWLVRHLLTGASAGRRAGR